MPLKSKETFICIRVKGVFEAISTQTPRPLRDFIYYQDGLRPIGILVPRCIEDALMELFPDNLEDLDAG